MNMCSHKQWSRRGLLRLAAGGFALPQIGLRAQLSSNTALSRLAIPGPYRGRVVAIEHPGSIVGGSADGKYQAEAVRQMMRRGIMELTGAPHWIPAWREFVQPGDVVGIKVNPSSFPYIVSDRSVVLEIIQSLLQAGVRPKDIVVYDRYREEFLSAGIDKWLPSWVRTASAVPAYDDIQQSTEGYDPDHFVDLPLVLPGQDLNSLSARRSYASRFIARDVNKLINLAVLKDHQAAGVTLTLKNLSHGLMNNVHRTHPLVSNVYFTTFTPSVVSLPVIRNKAVLHILDGIRGLYHSGPHAKPQFLWNNATMYFGTDPVAVDRIGWLEIDKKRAEVGMAPVAFAPPDEFSVFNRRQPDYIRVAGEMGLGESDETKIDLRRIRLI